MKNLIDMGIVEQRSNNTIESSYTTPDKAYIIKLRRKPRLSMFSVDSQSSYVCEIEFQNNIGISILTLRTTEMDIANMLDSFYNLIELNLGREVYHYFSLTGTDCIPKMAGLYTDDLYIQNNPYTNYYQTINNQYILVIYDKLDDGLVQRLSIKMNYQTVYDLLEKIYYTFLIDIPMDTVE
jgi:hypothetical protein